MLTPGARVGPLGVVALLAFGLVTYVNTHDSLVLILVVVGSAVAWALGYAYDKVAKGPPPGTRLQRALVGALGLVFLAATFVAYVDSRQPTMLVVGVLGAGVIVLIGLEALQRSRPQGPR